MNASTRVLFMALLGVLGTGPGASVAQTLPAVSRLVSSFAGGESLSAEDEAAVLRKLGWQYDPPKPKSRLAAPGNNMEQTTWYVGSWTNHKLGLKSYTQPSAANDYRGDDLPLRPGQRRWKRGGDPRSRPMNAVEAACVWMQDQAEIETER